MPAHPSDVPTQTPADAAAAEADTLAHATPAGPVEAASQRTRRLALSTAFFSFATGVSRVVGLAREIVAANYFGVTGPMSAFTVAFQVPNLVRALFADAALQGAFVPVFTELLEKGRRREALHVAASLFFLITLILGAATLFFVGIAPLLMPVFAPGLSHHLKDLVVTLSQIMFPIVLLMALTGVVVGMLNSVEHFAVPAIAPVAWNLVIIGALVGVRPLMSEEHQIYAYAIGVLGGTVVQFLMPLPWLRRYGLRVWPPRLDWRHPLVRRVLKLMLPVTIALGLINFSLLINSIFGSLVSNEAPAAIDRAFRIYMLPQGIFSVAIATILFPTLSRFAARGAYDDLRATMANGVRQIFLLLIPSATLMAVLAVPITRLIYQRGAFTSGATDLVSTAMVWWSLSLPFQGVSLLFSRTFFSIQRPWITTALSGGNLLVNAGVAAALYGPMGIGGVVLGTVVGTVSMCLAQGALLRRELRGIEAARTATAVVRMLAASSWLAAASYAVWWGLDRTLGRSLGAEIVAVGAAIAAGLVVYAVLALALRIDEAHQIRRLVAGRLRRGALA